MFAQAPFSGAPFAAEEGIFQYVVTPATGTVVVAGVAPTIKVDFFVTPGAGQIVIAGIAPNVFQAFAIPNNTSKEIGAAFASSVWSPFNFGRK